MDNFSSFMTNLQYIDAYSARQKIYKKDDGSIFGVYTITETVPTIIPFTPCIEYENADTVKDSDVSQWLMGLVVIDGDPNDPGSYTREATVYTNTLNIKNLSKGFRGKNILFWMQNIF